MGRLREAVALRERVGDLLGQRQEPGVTELCDLLEELLGDVLEPDADPHIERLTRGVYRVRTTGGDGRSFVLKVHQPAAAQTDRLVIERWLPALGLGAHGPRLLAAVAQRDGRVVWHVYEDVHSATLLERREPHCLGPAVDLVAELHTRAAGHPLLPEVRWHARDHGVHGLTAGLRDAIALLERIGTRWDAHAEFGVARRRLHDRLSQLLEEAPARGRMVEAAGGPDTLLHGDLWPKNVFVCANGDDTRVRLIDWDHVGVGSFSYDLSTLLYQSSPDERPWVLRRYRRSVERAAGWRLASDSDLNQMFHTAELARGASSVLWPALALLNDGADWGRSALVEMAQWFATLGPPLETVS